MVELKYEIEINGTWYSVGHELFRAWTGPRKLCDQIYHGAVYKYASDVEAVSGHEAYENYLNETE